MKIRNIILAAAAILAVAVSCKKEKPVLGVSLDPATLAFSADGGSFTVKATSSDTWTASVPTAAQEWLQVSPLSGSGEVTVTVTASANAGKPRAVTVNFTSGLFTEPLSISQEGKQKAGDGKTLATAFTASEAHEWVMQNLGDGEVSTESFYVKGVIHKMVSSSGVEQYFASNTYGNASFYISDDGSPSDNDFECFQVNYLGNRAWKSGNADVKVGDQVVIYGPVTNYKGNTAETTGKGTAYLCSLNGVVEEEKEQAEITSATVAEFIKTDGSTFYRLTGKVSSFKTGTNSSGKNYMQFNLTDATGTILVYGFKDGEYEKWSSKIEDGGTVVLTGTYEFYSAKSQHEVMKATIESFEPGQPQTEITDAKVADFIKSDGITYYRLTGVVSGFTTGQNSSGKNYMQFNLTDDTGTILVYGFKDGEYDKWADKLKDYGTVVLTGTYEFYSAKSQHEVMNTTIESFTEGEPPTEFEQLTVAEFIAKADPSKQFRLAGVVEEFAITNPEKGYLSFNLTDETGSILVYSLVEGQFELWSDKLEDGGDIVLVGSYKTYQNTPEVVNATIESFEANPDYKYCKIVGDTEIKLAATATEAGIEIKANAPWSITPDNQAASASPESGEGDAQVKLTVPANEDPDNEAVYKFVVKCEAAGVEATVTVTQKKAGSSEAIVLTFPDDNKDNNSVSAYNKDWKAMIGDYSWTISNFNNNSWKNWTYIKCGRKSDPSVAAITLDAAAPYAVKSVIVTVDQVNGADKINSTKLVVASDSAFSNVIAEVSVTLTEAGDINYDVSEPASGLYYKLVFDCAVHGSANGIIQISKVTYSAD